LQGKISSDSCLKKEQMVVSAIVSTPQLSVREGLVHIWQKPGKSGLRRSLKGRKLRASMGYKVIIGDGYFIVNL
ncbi:hypothetical protein OSK71_12245, partial [Escherichia coli]|nr:hypothetical protein [Escherichia coli]